MRTFRHLALAVAAVLGMASCASPDKIHFNGIEGASMSGMKSVQLTANVSNDSHSNLRIRRAHVALLDGSTVVAELVLSEEVVVPRRSEGPVVMPFNLVVSNPMALLTLPGKFKNGGEGLFLSVDMTARGGLARKNYSIAPTPLPDLLKKAGITPEQLGKYFRR